MSTAETRKEKTKRFDAYSWHWYDLRAKVQFCEDEDNRLDTRESEKALETAEHDLRVYEEAHPEEEKHRYESELASRRKNAQ